MRVTARAQPCRLASSEDRMLTSSTLVTATTVPAERMFASSRISGSRASPWRTTIRDRAWATASARCLSISIIRVLAPGYVASMFWAR